MRPTLRDKTTFTIDDYPENTAYEAGYLVTKNAGWRSARPVVDGDKCSGCLQCYLYCPDGVISWRDDAGNLRSRDSIDTNNRRAHIIIDYDFCKGCGICEKICKVGAINLISESEAGA